MDTNKENLSYTYKIRDGILKRKSKPTRKQKHTHINYISIYCH